MNKIAKDATLTLTMPNDLTEITRLAGEIETHGAARGWPERWVFNLNLALEELITNVVRYGYADAARHEIRVTLAESEGALVVELEDDGRAFDPFRDAPAPDVCAALEARPVGGLGVHLTKSLMDAVAYERRDGRNHVTLMLRELE